MVKQELIQGCTRILEVELDHFDLVGKDIHGNVDTLCNSNEILIFIGLRVKHRNWFEQSSHHRVLVQVVYSEAAWLHVQKLGHIKNSLVLLAGHPVEQNRIIGLAQEGDAVHLLLQVLHWAQAALHLLDGLYQRGQRVAHEEHWKVLLVDASLLRCVVENVHESILVFFIRNSCVTVAGHVDTVEFFKKLGSFL